MKKITFLLLLTFTVTNIYSQNYNISFIATGINTIVDSVKVENLTQGTFLTLDGSDILHLGSVDINETSINDKNIQIYPNPAQGKVKLSFYAKQDGNTQITIYDISGKKVLQINNKLLQGIQNYQILGLKQGIYFININSNSYFYTEKLISQNNTPSETKIEYLESTKSNTTTNNLKNTKTTINMSYTTGDTLRFTGYLENINAIVTDVPTSSKVIAFTFCPSFIIDIDGNSYNTVLISTQCWMRENLKTTKYNNGNPIPNVTNDSVWNVLTTGAYCNYDNDTNNVATYGRLYNFFSLAFSTNHICPTGWHIPTDNEWTVLTTYLGGTSVAGGKMKEIGTMHWDLPNTGATNESGFTALPGGYRFSDLSFFFINQVGAWWSFTDSFGNFAWTRSTNNDSSNVERASYLKNSGFSVRCVRD